MSSTKKVTDEEIKGYQIVYPAYIDVNLKTSEGIGIYFFF